MNQQNNCTGTVKWWSRLRGYGFIHHCPAYPGLDIIVHYSDILDDGGEGRHMDLYDEQPVTFDAMENVVGGKYKGMKAVNVRARRGA